MNDEPRADPESWVDRHGDCLYRYAIVRLRTPDLAADVVQDTFLEALRARASFAGRASERTWLIGILRHKIVDQIRKNGREAHAQNGYSSNGADEKAFDGRGHWRKSPASWRGNPSKQMESKEFWEVFGRCMSKLPAGIADAFFLRELDGASADDIQDTLGITPANFWNAPSPGACSARPVPRNELVHPPDDAVHSSLKAPSHMSRLKDLWRLLNLPCEQITRLSSESLDRDLTRFERAALQSHIVYCAGCRRDPRQLKLIKRAFQKYATRLETDDALPGPTLPQAVRERIKRMLRDH